MTYEEACAACDAVAAAERADARIDPICYSRVLDRGAQSERAIAFFHGFTNCPQQFAELGQRFFDAGFNVYIPRLPGHGMKDKMTTALADYTGDDLTAAAAAAADVAAGLGSRAHVAGISLGGVLAAWVGDQRPIACATAISPFMGIARVPAWANAGLGVVLDALPNLFVWWDPRAGAENPATPSYAYARYPTHMLAAQLRISATLRSSAKDRRARACVSGLFVNAHDPAVNNRISAELYDRWAQRGNRVVRRTLDAGRLPHDIVDNSAGRLPVETIYPSLLEFVEGADALASS
ncbi:MAG: alpha/beta hydrolase [Candidatus Eremiobacteraeota bacterium]|nr:alpha/beta hydrolase [Candidatus Eremiobacteraeota bacterium]MBV8281831.1 alpha/beta hydrolase [Candidatus Eremiobacteraeota bacterium]